MKRSHLPAVVGTICAIVISGAAWRPAYAQATISGTVALQERSGDGRGDISNAVIFLERRGSGSTPEAAAPRNEMSAIEMKGREFLPHVTVVSTGSSVFFPNEDPFKHNVFSNVELGPFDLGLYPRGASRPARFPHAGIYPIYCNIHSKMVTFVVAVPTPWATQPDASGKFTLRNVPPGTYVLHAWHERGEAELKREIVVPANGLSELQLVIDARTYLEGPHLNKYGRPYTVLRADRY
jgi:plastocyanin